MPLKFMANRIERFFIYRVLHVDDTPHRIALGVAIGMFITWTPTIGFQMLLVIALSALLRANKLVGVPFVWISNPLTFVPIYGPNFWVGSKILGGAYSHGKFLSSLTKAAVAGGGWVERIGNWWHATVDFFWPLWIGSLIVATCIGVATYVAIYYLVVTYRKHPLRRHLFHRGKGGSGKEEDNGSDDAGDKSERRG